MFYILLHCSLFQSFSLITDNPSLLSLFKYALIQLLIHQFKHVFWYSKEPSHRDGFGTVLLSTTAHRYVLFKNTKIEF